MVLFEMSGFQHGAVLDTDTVRMVNGTLIHLSLSVKYMNLECVACLNIVFPLYNPSWSK